VRAECPYYRKKKPSVVWASLPAIPVGLGKNSAGRMPILQKEKTIGSVGIPARSTEWDSAKTVRAECPHYRKGKTTSSAGRMPILQKEKSIGSVGIPARNTEWDSAQAVRAECPYYKEENHKQCGQNAHTTDDIDAVFLFLLHHSNRSITGLCPVSGIAAPRRMRIQS
jgi:hypothetical protein